MNTKFVPFMLVVILGATKLIFLALQPEKAALFAWITFSCLCVWNAWAYWKDKDMLGRTSNIRFMDGCNRLDRSIYLAVLLLVYYFLFLVL